MTDKPPAPDPAPGPGRARVSPWPDRIALILIWLAGIVITLVWQRPKGAGLYADFWFGTMITLALILGYAMLKRALGLPPVTLKLRRPRNRRRG
jgi:hypothetical protein